MTLRSRASRLLLEVDRSRRGVDARDCVVADGPAVVDGDPPRRGRQCNVIPRSSAVYFARRIADEIYEAAPEWLSRPGLHLPAPQCRRRQVHANRTYE
jgi:hypothetical protein